MNLILWSLLIPLFPSLLSYTVQYDLATIHVGEQTTLQNTLWSEDAFPSLPKLRPNTSLTIGYFNTTGGGVVSLMHLTLVYANRSELDRHVALSITYNNNPFPSVFVPIGDFFVDHFNSMTSNYEGALLSKRNINSWWCHTPLHYKKAIKIELVSRLQHTVRGYNFVKHENVPFTDSTGYFHAHFSLNHGVVFPWTPVPIVQLAGPGHIVGVSMAMSSPNSTIFPPGRGVTHFCEGNVEWFIDNSTVIQGNNKDNNPAVDGYQSSRHLTTFLGTEDFYGYSYGWSQRGGMDWAGLTYLGVLPNKWMGLATYRFWDKSPIRFSKSLHAQVNWLYDVGGPGKNIPSDLCGKHGTHKKLCVFNYDITVFSYLHTPQDATNAKGKFPWPIEPVEP